MGPGMKEPNGPDLRRPPEVIVVGAGPAGCAVAAFLGRAGHRVLLVDRARVPRPRLCTHALMPSALPVLGDLGVLDAVLAAGAQRWWGVRLMMEGTLIEADLPQQGAAAPFGLSLRREYLDPILFGAALREPCVQAALGWTALAPLIERGGVRGLRLRAPDGSYHTVRARLLVAADGRHSQLLAAAGSRPRTLPNRHAAWIAYVTGVPHDLRPALEAYYRGGRSVSLLPADGGLRVAGVVVPHNRWRRADASQRMMASMRAFPELRERLADARIVSPPVDVRGLRNAARLTTVPGIVPAGDAALQSDPAFGQGIAWALRGARRLAHAIDAALTAPGDEPVVVAASAAREPLTLPLTLGMSAFSAIPPGSLLERIIVRSAARSPRTSALALRLATGFATAAPDNGPRRGPGAFLREVLAPSSALPALRASRSISGHMMS
jgi:2-polyprenyl-6-methoxyphenol hydroxylase-like FAD-dependent oxidoreductase